VTDVPKAAITAGDGAFVSEFVETHCRITKDSFGGPVGDLLSLRPWQREMFGRLLARQPGSLQRRHRFGLVGVPRKNGKSAMIAGLALYGLLMEDAGAEVYSVAGDRDQARLVFGTAKRMVEMDAELSAVTKLYRDAIEDPASGSVYRAVSAEAPLKEGLSPTLTVVDEVHVINEDLWNVFALAMGARPEPLLVGITTAGARYDSRGRETICYRLWQYGTQLATGHESDPSFYFEWWGAPEELDYRLPSTWALANPGYGDILDPADLAAAVGPTMEPEYRTKRLNQWVDHSTAAFPVGAWKACDAPGRVVSASEPIVLGFDGSWTGDSTAIVGCTVADRHLFVVDAWEKPPNANGWRVDAATVDTRVRAFCRRSQRRRARLRPVRVARPDPGLGARSEGRRDPVALGLARPLHPGLEGVLRGGPRAPPDPRRRPAIAAPRRPRGVEDRPPRRAARQGARRGEDRPAHGVDDRLGPRRRPRLDSPV
jgi:phage terminase large subunit-like protein